MMKIELTEEQSKAAEMLGAGRISLLTGGPGTGKTTTLAQYAKTLKPMDTVYCAPTGRAAQRMGEALEEAGLKGVKARTIHSLLIPARNGHDKKGWTFEYNKYNRLPWRTVVVDEVSMLDNSLAWSLLQSLRHDAKIIMIGDPDQLPPVSAGAFLRDLITSKQVPHAHLTHVHRFAGRIAHACKAIKADERWAPSPVLNLNPNAGEFGPENFRHIERATPEESLNALQRALPLIKEKGFDLHRDVQVVCCRNEKGGVNRMDLNNRLQGLLNPTGERIEGVPYRVGDKIMCLSNGTRKTYDKHGFAESQAYIANGEIGICTAVAKKHVSVIFDGSKIIQFAAGQWESECTLAYAITTHKAQGGGWPVNIYMIDDAHNVDRSLVYTALSRAKKLEVTIGKLQTLYRQCGKVAIEYRKTFLSEFIQHEVQNCAL